MDIEEMPDESLSSKENHQSRILSVADASWRETVFGATDEAGLVRDAIPCNKCKLDEAMCLRDLASPCYRCAGLGRECRFDGIALGQLLHFEE